MPWMLAETDWPTRVELGRTVSVAVLAERLGRLLLE